MCKCFKTETDVAQNLINDLLSEELSIRRILSEKKWGTGLIYDKTEAMCTELNKRAEAATCSYSATGNFFTIYLLCL